jgi:hypothetical protein
LYSHVGRRCDRARLRNTRDWRLNGTCVIIAHARHADTFGRHSGVLDPYSPIYRNTNFKRLSCSAGTDRKGAGVVFVKRAKIADSATIANTNILFNVECARDLARLERAARKSKVIADFDWRFCKAKDILKLGSGKLHGRTHLSYDIAR